MTQFLDDELRMIQNQAREFTMNEVKPEADEKDNGGPEGGRMSQDLIDKLADMGYFGITAPEEYGGLDLGPLALAVITEELARGWMSVASIIVRGGDVPNATEEQRERWVPDQVAGKSLGAGAITEPGHGSNVAGMETTAVKDGDEYVLNGEKMFCTHAKNADHITIYAKTDPDADPPHRGISSFRLEKPAGTFDYPGLTGNKIDTIGYHGWHSYHLQLNDVRIPEENLIGREEGRAFYSVMEGFETARVHTAARALGCARGALEDSLEYAQDRTQFGQPIGEFQAIRFKLAKMATKLEAARQLTHAVAARKEEGGRCDREACMAKYFASEVAEEITSEGIQIHGGNGYTTDYSVERYWRDARLTKIFEGTSEIQLRVVADRLFENGPYTKIGEAV